MASGCVGNACMGTQGASCDTVCAGYGGSCNSAVFSAIDNCATFSNFGTCEAGCRSMGFSDQPCYVSEAADSNYQWCLTSAGAATCGGSHPNVRRLCPCTCVGGQYLSGGGCTDVGAGYYSPAGDSYRYQCSAGYYCSTTTNSASTGNGACTAGYYCTAGSTSATQNACGAGKYCPAGSSGTTNCAAGYYGSSTTNSVSTCNGACTAGYYCTAGSTSATQNACGTGNYCPAASGSATVCPAGTYGSTTTLTTSSCTGQCSAGYYGSSTGQTAATCNGACTAGYYCTAGSTSATQNVCGTGKYCPAGSSGTTNCAAGYYGSSTTNSVSTCNGACTAGYYCTAGSTSATQNTCTNKPLNSNYNSTSGTNSCGFSCAGNLESKFGCATAGNNTNIHFLNNVSSYSNLTLKVGSKIYLNNSNLTISQLILDGSGDKIIINSGSQLIINGSN